MVKRKDLQEALEFFTNHVEVVDVSDKPQARSVTTDNDRSAPRVSRGFGDVGGEEPASCPNCPHPIKGLHHYKTGRCKLCACEGPHGSVKGAYASKEAKAAPPTTKRSRRKKKEVATPLAKSLGLDDADLISPESYIRGTASLLGAEFRRLTKPKKGRKT